MPGLLLPVPEHPEVPQALIIRTGRLSAGADPRGRPRSAHKISRAMSPPSIAGKQRGRGVGERCVWSEPVDGTVDRLGGLIIVKVVQPAFAARAKNSLRDTPSRAAATWTRLNVSSGRDIAAFTAQV